MLHTEILDDTIGLLRLASPENRNALSRALLAALLAALEDFARRAVRVILLAADTEPHGIWSAGADISELPPPGQDPQRHADLLPALMRAVRGHPAPVIAMVRGSVWGGATELALSCDLVTADTSATFAITPANLGLPYNPSGIHALLRRLPLNIVREMFYTARPLTAQEAREAHLLNHLYLPEQLEKQTLKLAHTIAGKAPLAITAIKEQTRLLTEAIALSPEQTEYLQDLRQRALASEDLKEGLVAFQERRKPQFQGT